MGRRILYVQFTDPAAYPPVEHSAVLFAKRGWDVLLLGTGTVGDLKLVLQTHPRICVLKVPFVRPGWKQKLSYIVFFFRFLYLTWRWQPDWIYASDPFAAPLAWLLRKFTKVRVVYHEHDSPNLQEPPSGFMNLVFTYRKKLGRDADLCVLPQRERLHQFVEETQRLRPTFCVWNCPKLDEISEPHRDEHGELLICYHGSINRARLPPPLIVAASRLGRRVRLQVAGYQTDDQYLAELMKLASKNGAPELIEYGGVIKRRRDLLRYAAGADVGVSLMPKHTVDANLRHMVGASNKPFDYMACGLPLLVSALPEWISTFVEPGYALACDPDDPDTIEIALRWYLERPLERREMGRRGREEIRHAWNYDNMFKDVLAEIESSVS